jgi:hypothetical protein
MICGREFLTGWLLLVALSWQAFSLSPEDAAFRAGLGKKPKADVIEIAMLYRVAFYGLKSDLDEIDQISTEKSSLWIERERFWIERTNSMKERERSLDELEAGLTLQKQLWEESWEIQEEQNKKKFWDGFWKGAVTGGVLGTATGGITGYKIGERL